MSRHTKTRGPVWQKHNDSGSQFVTSVMVLYAYLRHTFYGGVLKPTTVAVAPLSWDTWKRVPPAHCRSDWALCRLAVAGYDVWCVWLVRRLAWWCRIIVVIAWRCTRTSSTHWVVVTQSPTTVAAAPQSWDTWKRVPPAHCRLACALCRLAVTGYNVVWLGCCYADAGYVVVWCVCCMVAFGARLWRVVGVVVLCSVAWRV